MEAKIEKEDLMKYAADVRILAANELRFGEKGLELVMGQNSFMQNEPPNIPERRRF
mgnify:CR=1 FL=1